MLSNSSTQQVTEAWHNYQRQLLAFIRAKVNSPEDAQDILQEVFVKLTKTINDKALPANVSAWLYHVSQNTIVDYYRTKKSHHPLPEDLSDEIAGKETIKQLASCLLPMIQALPEVYQQALLMSEIEDQQYQAVAQALNLSLPAVKSRILRGRAELHKSLLRCCEIEQNSAGQVIDYTPKSASSCQDC